MADRIRAVTHRCGCPGTTCTHPEQSHPPEVVALARRLAKAARKYGSNQVAPTIGWERLHHGDVLAWIAVAEEALTLTAVESGDTNA